MPAIEPPAILFLLTVPHFRWLICLKNLWSESGASSIFAIITTDVIIVAFLQQYSFYEKVSTQTFAFHSTTNIQFPPKSRKLSAFWSHWSFCHEKTFSHRKSWCLCTLRRLRSDRLAMAKPRCKTEKNKIWETKSSPQNQSDSKERRLVTD